MLILDTTECRRCLGTGCIDQYARVEGGVCFNCRGTRRQLTNDAAAAAQAFETAKKIARADMPAVAPEDVREGDYVDGLPGPVDKIEPMHDGAIFFFYATVNGKQWSVSCRAGRKAKRSDPGMPERVAREIAATMPGATWRD